MEQFKSALNHPLTFWFAMVLLVTAGQKLFGAGFRKIGMSGPANFFSK